MVYIANLYIFIVTYWEVSQFFWLMFVKSVSINLLKFLDKRVIIQW